MSEKRGNTMRPKDYEGGESLDNFHANFQILRDIEFVSKLLPSSYIVQESNSRGSIHCKSSIGIKMPRYRNQSTGEWVNDAEDTEMWEYIVKAIKQHFGERFQEIFHNTCFLHTDFTIYLKPTHK
jgi:hypothetical protein